MSKPYDDAIAERDSARAANAALRVELVEALTRAERAEAWVNEAVEALRPFVETKNSMNQPACLSMTGYLCGTAPDGSPDPHATLCKWCVARALVESQES